MSRRLSFVLLVLSLSLVFLDVSAGVGKNAMLLQDVSTLIFTKGEMTNARRSSPVPQMSCKGGACQYAPATAMCRNIGFDGSDVTWQCEAELPKGVKFGKVEVSCEGHGSRDDEYVLKGSCGLEYWLQGEARFDSEVKEEDSWWNRNVRHTAGKHSGGQHAQHSSSSWFTAPWSWFTGAQAAASNSYHHAKDNAQHQYDKAADYVQHHHNAPHHSSGHHTQSGSTGLFGLISYLISTLFSMGVKLIAALIVFFVLWRLMRPAASVQQPVVQQQRPGILRSVLGMLPLFGGSGLASGLSNAFSGGQNGNPPPYNPPPPPYDAAGFDKRYYSSAAQQQQAQAQQAQAQQQQGGSGYNVLHGLLGGSLLGYFMGQRRANQQQPAATYTQQPSTVHHVHHNAPPSVNPAYARSEQQRYPTAGTSATTRADGTLRATGASIEDVSDVSTTETSTAYARTKRR